jgi:hypothetical protein
MRQNLAWLNDNLIKMAQIFDWRATAIVKHDIALFERVIGYSRRYHGGAHHEWQ